MTHINWTNFRAERQRRGKPFIVAHRGVPGQAPENTLRSFSLALAQGAFALETDLRFTKDDQLVCFHDETLTRTTNGDGYIRDYTLGELKQLRTKQPGTQQTGDDTIPTLVELIQASNANTPLLLELKDPLFQDRQYARKLIDVLAAFGMIERCAIVSFKLALVATIEDLCPTLPTGIITLTNPIPQAGVELLGPVWPLLYANPLYVAWAHRYNSVVCPLDTTPEKRMEYYLWLGVDAVLTDDTKAALQAIEES